MSHELRTPLQNILGFCQLLDSEASGPLSDQQRHYVRQVELSGRRLVSLINEVLELPKIAGGTTDLAATGPSVGCF